MAAGGGGSVGINGTALTLFVVIFPPSHAITFFGAANAATGSGSGTCRWPSDTVRGLAAVIVAWWEAEGPSQWPDGRPASGE